MRRSFAVLLTCSVFALSGCGGGDSAPTGPTFPDITGTYSGNWTLEVTNQNNGQSASASCPGSVTVASQSEDSFSGSYRIDATQDCNNDSGDISGSVRTDGGINFTLSSASGSSASFEDITGCTVTGGDNQLTGNVTSGNMSVDASFFADCPDGSGGTFPTRWDFGFSGS